MDKLCYNVYCHRRNNREPGVWHCSNAEGCKLRLPKRQQLRKASRVCGNCAGWDVENEVCCEARSEHCADFTVQDYSCPAWTESPEQ